MNEQETLQAFAQIHLATPAERAVYLSFVDGPGRPRSANEVASAAGLQEGDVADAFARFAEAGIVQECDGSFVWQEGLRYVFEPSETGTSMQDPVCGMPVGLDSPHMAQDVFGRTERFCSDRCLVSFLVWPVAFTRPAHERG